jgi:hypothetical protein
MSSAVSPACGGKSPVKVPVAMPLCTFEMATRPISSS